MLFRIPASPVFPAGTSVSAYLHDSDLDGTPSGSIVDTQTMGDHLLFRNLEEGRSYWAVGNVGGQLRRVLFYVNEVPPFDPDPKDLREFAIGGAIDFKGESDSLPAINESISYLNQNGPGAAVAWPAGTYLLDGELDDVIGGRAQIFTFGAGVTKLIKAEGITTGRFWNIIGSSASVNIGGFSYFYGGTTDGTNPGPTDKECAVRFGDTAQGVIGDSQINGGAGMVEFSGDCSGCTMGTIKGNIDWSLGGWMIKNLGCASARVGDSQVNGKTDTSGANAGGGMMLVKPGVGDSADGGTYKFCYAQGPNCEGPDYGLLIDGTDAAAINNQRFISNTWDHCYRYEIAIVANPGSTCRGRNIQIKNPRCSGDGPAHYKYYWQSTQPMQVEIDDSRMTFRAVKRPVFVSSAPNTLTMRFRDDDFQTADSIAGQKRLFNFAAGRWKVTGLTASAGKADPTTSAIEAGGENIPYEVRVLIVDAKGGTWSATKAGGSTAAGLAATITAANLQTALQAAGLYGAGNVIVEGGPGGIFGPLRTRLSSPYTIGDGIMHLQDASVAVAPPGPCKIGGGGSGGSGNIAYTGIDTGANTLTGCTGGSGGPFTGSTVVTFPTDEDPDDDTEGNGAVYYLIFKGIYAPTATTAPGYGATPVIPALTVDGTNLTGSGECGGGLKLALIDTISAACPLNNYGVPGSWGVADLEKIDNATADFIDFPGYTTAVALPEGLTMQGTLAQRPAFGVPGRRYLQNDVTPKVLFFDIGTAWKTVGLS